MAKVEKIYEVFIDYCDDSTKHFIIAIEKYQNEKENQIIDQLNDGLKKSKAIKFLKKKEFECEQKKELKIYLTELEDKNKASLIDLDGKKEVFSVDDMFPTLVEPDTVPNIFAPES